MMIRAIERRIFHGRDFIPQALIKKPISYFEGKHGLKFIEDLDDLGYFVVALFEAEEHIFALMKYRGEPENLTMLYILADPRNVPSADSEVRSVIHQLGLVDEDVQYGGQ